MVFLGMGVSISPILRRLGTALAAITDSFDRANNASSLGVATTGQTWIATGGTWGIDTNRAYSSTSGVAMAVIPTEANDGVLVCTLNRAASNIGVVVRCNNAGAGGWLIRSEGVNLIIQENFGSSTIVQQVAQAWSGSHTLTVSCSGTGIAVKYDGVDKLSITETVHQTGTHHGIWKNSGSTTTHWYDTFSFTPS